MRWLAVALLLVAGDARADRSIETWVGTWTGKAHWSGCTVGDAEQVNVKVAWHDGMLWIDATGLYEGLGEVAPEVRAGGALVFENEDLAVTMKPGKPGKKKSKGKKPTFTLTTAAQCKLTATITRDGTGDAACDGLAALTSVADACGEPVELDDTQSCAARSEDLRAALVAAECLPPEDDPVDIPACRAVWQAASRLMKCDYASVELKQSTLRSIADLKHGLRKVDRELAAAKCDEAAAILQDNAELLHCP